MKSQSLPVWLFWLTQTQALTIPGAVERNIGAHEGSHAQYRRDGEVERRNAETSNYLTTYGTEDIIPVTETVSVSTSTIQTGVVEILPSLDDVEPQTEGIIITKIEASGDKKDGPLLTQHIPKPTSLLQPITTRSEAKRAEETDTSSIEMAEDSDKGVFARAATNIFANPIDTSAPPSVISQRSDHPVARLGLTKNGPLQTNKFYSNFFLGSQTQPTFTFPYSVAWAGGTGAAASWGLAISHIAASQRVFGDVVYNNAAEYYINPVGIQSMIISAQGLSNKTILTVDSVTPYSARVNLKKDSSSNIAIQYPLVQGMQFVTAKFNGARPMIQSAVYFKTMTRVTKDPKTNVAKYNFVLEDGTTWRLYAYKTKGEDLNLALVNNGLAQTSKAFYGIIQIAKDPKQTGSEAALDDGCGIYPSTVKLTGSVSGTVGTYSFDFVRNGHATGNLYMHALPHHVASFNADTTSRVISTVKMQTTTKGLTTLVKGTTWTLTEPNLPTTMGLTPWSPTKGAIKTLSAKAKVAIKAVAQVEISQDMIAQTNLESMYFSGKAFAKFGQIIYVLNEMLGEKDLALAGLEKLKTAFSRFVTNKQTYPLVYESAWGGVVSSATYKTGDSGLDFGNTYYNDHHFHYGYHILAAAYIAKYDKTWLAANKAWVQMLIRDYANPSTSDPYFPAFRSFDWYHGHSWATGLFAQWDGKNQESSSEDVMAMHAIKCWGQVIGDTNMVARANLQLAIQARSMKDAYLYTSDNIAQPSNFIGNKVAGIVFENKVHHTTFFSADIEAIQGIHMIPIGAPSFYTRSAAFVTQEWNAYFSNGRIDKIANAWKSIIYANYATINPTVAWNYFNSTNFNANYIDGGASQTWYMAYAAGE
ncbi:glycosyl hydrolase family 81-domain-containing protein [Dactylonectria estremocensis]|uniref:glucan endo-1,3-beta-D-glucosidase n=1 Tax=Dactylonectria estremocensis TaxID=1079267 RepID=A0A9P9FBY1_9HYPO|nr:glycosyl hydrolase family 81-domain-containing protein [Dactylonectria estremocensis]